MTDSGKPVKGEIINFNDITNNYVTLAKFNEVVGDINNTLNTASLEDV